MSAPAQPAGVRTGSAAVANLLRRVCSEAGGVAALVAETEGEGAPRIVAVPPPGSQGSLDVRRLEDVVRQLSADPELERARVVVRSVHLGEPFTLAAVPMADPSGVVAVLRDTDRLLGDDHVDALVRAATRLSRHFGALRQLAARTAHGEAPGQTRGAPGTSVPAGAPPPAAPPPAASPAVSLLPMPPDPPFAESEVRGGAAGLVSEHAVPASPASAPDAAHGGGSSSGQGPVPATGPAAGPASISPGRDERKEADGRSSSGTSFSRWCVSSDAATGLSSPARFFSRAGQLLRAPARQSHAFVLVLIEIPNEETARSAARAITGQLRASDPVARVDRDLFALAVLVGTEPTAGEYIEERVGSAVRGALEWLSPVRTTHVRAEPGDLRDVDELLLYAISALPGR